MNSAQPIKSSGGILYYIEQKDNAPRFLLLKRYALSKKIEWVAPKGKIMNNESPENCALREAEEETGLKKDKLEVEKFLGKINLFLESEEKGSLNKEILYYLVRFYGEPDEVFINNVEGYLGIYKWAKIEEALGLIYYENLREIYREAYNTIKQKI